MENPAIQIENVSLIRNGKAILKDFSWCVEEGVHWVLMGPNGSGKTTLLKLIAGYLWPTKGAISVLGFRFGEVDLRFIRRKIGWVGSFLQEHISFEQRPKEIILSGKMGSLWLYEKPDKDDIRTALEIADLVGCSEFLDMPYGLLSQGEKQRVLLGRALFAKPRLLLLDEPCAGLDIVAREQFLRILSSISYTLPVTIILVTHHLEEITPLFSKILLLKKGTVLAHGPVGSVLNDSILTALYEIPIQTLAFNGRYYGYIRWNGSKTGDSKHETFRHIY